MKLNRYNIQEIILHINIKHKRILHLYIIVLLEVRDVHFLHENELYGDQLRTEWGLFKWGMGEGVEETLSVR